MANFVDTSFIKTANTTSFPIVNVWFDTKGSGNLAFLNKNSNTNLPSRFFEVSRLGDKYFKIQEKSVTPGCVGVSCLDQSNLVGVYTSSSEIFNINYPPAGWDFGAFVPIVTQEVSVEIPPDGGSAAEFDYSAFSPIYFFISILLIIGAVIGAYKLILHPFWRKRL